MENTEKKRKTVETFTASPELAKILTQEFDAAREAFNTANNALNRVKKSLERAGLPRFEGEEKTVHVVSPDTGRTIAEVSVAATTAYTVPAGWKNTIRVTSPAVNPLMDLGAKLAKIQAEINGIRLPEAKETSK